VGGSAWLLDQITPQPTAAYSTRKVKSSATLALQLCDFTGTTTSSCGFDGSDDLDQTAVGTFYTANSNSANCSGLFDQSGNGRNFISTVTAAANTVLKWSTVDSGNISTVNGHPALFFVNNNGRDRLTSSLHASDLMSASAFTVIQSVRVDSFNTTAITTATNIGMLADGNDGYVGSGIPMSFITIGNVVRANTYHGGKKVCPIAASAPATYIIVTRLGSGVLALWLNGSVTNSVSSVGNIGDMGYQTMTLGCQATEFACRLLDTLVYNTALSNADINTLCTASGVTNGNIASRAGVTWTNI
jgi:hypothetical protein